MMFLQRSGISSAMALLAALLVATATSRTTQVLSSTRAIPFPSPQQTLGRMAGALRNKRESSYSSSRTATGTIRTRQQPPPTFDGFDTTWGKTKSPSRTSSTTTETVTADDTLITNVADIAEAFENGVLEASAGGIHGGLQINMPRLLHACRRFEAAMKKVGETQSAKDLHNNILKVEALYRSAPVAARHSMYSLLKYEKELGVHPSPAVPALSGTNNSDRPVMIRRLKDPSGAMGLLWIRRSLAFSCKFYAGVVGDENNHQNYDSNDDPIHHPPHTSCPTPKDAALAAYEAVLQPYHGWALQRLYTLAFQAGTPPRNEFLARMGGFDPHAWTQRQEQATIRDLRRLVAAWEPLIAKWEQVFQDLDLDDTRQV